jgi:hypothetical protein
VSTPDIAGALLSASGSPSAIPVVNEALEPASVRNGSAAVKQDYQEALGFESVLVNELAQQLVSSSGLSSDGSQDAGTSATSGDASASDFASLLPSALTNSIMSNGGLGLAAQLMPSLTGANSATSVAPTATPAGSRPGQAS